MTTAGCDVLVLAPHTDDAEIALGGTIHLLTEQGRRVWVADLTRGELGSNATPDERWLEAAQATQVLGLAGRLQLGLPDGFIASGDPAQVRAVVAVIRLLRPRWVVTAPDSVRHPDHAEMPSLARKACFLARLASLDLATPDLRVLPAGSQLPSESGPWETEALLHTCSEGTQANMIFDVSRHWEAKQEALRCFASQFLRQPGTKPTAINDPAFLEKIERRGRSWGQRVGCAYGEALCTNAVAKLVDLPRERWLS